MNCQLPPTSSCGATTMSYPNAEIASQMWTFTGGTILVLLQSILSGANRNWWSLLIGCGLGGAGSWVASQIWQDSPYIYIICGVAAVVAENLLMGIVGMSKQFADNPLKVFTHLARTFLPTFGKSVGDTSESLKTDELK